MTSRALSAVLAAGVLVVPLAAESLVPGSVLVYPRTGTGPGGAFSLVTITNTNFAPATPTSLGGTTAVHFEYVNMTSPAPSVSGGPSRGAPRVAANPSLPGEDGANQAITLNCLVSDRVELLTPADTLSVLTICHNPFQGGLGYLVVSALDPMQFQAPWGHDHLVGSEVVLGLTGTTYGLPAIAFQAQVPAGAPTDIDGDGNLDFDGVEYSQVPDELYADGVVANPSARLILLELSGGAAFQTTARFDVFNDNEGALSVTTNFSCWMDSRWEDISLLFTEGFLATNTVHDPAELDLTCDGVGDEETFWARIRGLVSVSTQSVIQDPALLGALGGETGALDAGRPLWHSKAGQNGIFLNFGSSAPAGL